MTKEQLGAARRRAIKLMAAGWLQAEVAQAVGVHERTVRQWGQHRREHGLASLVRDERGRAVGEGRRLGAAQEKELQKCQAALLADSTTAIGAAETWARLKASQETIARERPTWNVQSYRDEAAFYQAEAARRQRPVQPAATH